MRPVPNNPTPHRRPTRCRRGSTAVLAMLFLILFSTLAVGFFASTTTSVQIAGNEHRNLQAQLAAESGMEFMKYQMATLAVPAGTPADQLFGQVYSRLRAKLEGYPNMTGRTITMSADGNYIFVPGSGDGYINTDANGARFHAVLEKLAGGQRVGVKVVGRFGHSENARAIRLEYAVAQNAGRIFNYGVASRSRILLNSNAKIRGGSDPDLGSVLSTAPGSTTTKILKLEGNAQVTGEITFTDPSAHLHGLVMSSNATVGNNPAARRSDTALLSEYVNYDVPEPEFPTVNTDVFKEFAGNPTYGGLVINRPSDGSRPKYDSGTIRNLLIKANSNPIFDSNLKIDGVIYIETPNQVTFSSNTAIRGAIVVQNNPTGDHNSNLIEFSSNVTIAKIESLVGVNNTYFPKKLTDLTGATILAPKFNVHFNSNFGSTGGSIIADKIHFDSNARGTIRGSVINLADTMVEMDSNADITIESLGTNNFPAGVYFGSYYTPLRDTYAEVAP